MNIVDDKSEFGQLIQQVAHKDIPAYIEGLRVFITNGVPLKEGGRILREVPNFERNELCFCGSGKKFKKCCMGAVV